MNRRAASVRFIFITILLDAMGVGVLIPVFPDVLRRFTADSAAVSTYFGLFISVYALMQFLASPVLGSLSDRFGRKPVLLGSLLGAAVDYVIMALAPTLTILFAGRVISGLTGASMTVASSYMADISTEKDRSANFGMIGAAWGLGFITGPMLGGLLSAHGPRAPFYAAAALNFLNFLFGAFVLPESLDPAHRRTLSGAALNPFASLVKVLRPSPVRLLIVLYFLLFLAGQVHPANWTLYTQLKFGWTARQVGFSLSFVGLVIALANGGLTRVLIPRWGEERSLTFGVAVYVVAFALFAAATRGWMMYAIMAFFSLSGVAIPALQSIVARHVPANEQGELQGSLVSLGSLAAILGPLVFTYLFVRCTSLGARVYFPGAAYAGASAICALSLGLRFMKRGTL
jgi:DHA1 family tetracycline resistance protein-like MFS transporter